MNSEVTVFEMPNKRSGKPSLPIAVAELVRAKMQVFLDRDFEGNKTALARALKITQPAVTQLLAGTNRASYESLEKVARYEGVPPERYFEPATLDDDPYPNRTKAIEAARKLGKISERVIRTVLAEPVPDIVVGDPDAWFWFRRLESLAALESTNTSAPPPKSPDPTPGELPRAVVARKKPRARRRRRP